MFNLFLLILLNVSLWLQHCPCLCVCLCVWWDLSLILFLFVFVLYWRGRWHFVERECICEHTTKSMDLDFDDESAAPAGDFYFLSSLFWLVSLLFLFDWFGWNIWILTARAGAKFKPRGRPQPKKKQAQTTLSTDVAKEKLSTQSEHPVSLDASSAYPSSIVSSLKPICILYVVPKLISIVILFCRCFSFWDYCPW